MFGILEETRITRKTRITYSVFKQGRQVFFEKNFVQLENWTRAFHLPKIGSPGREKAKFLLLCYCKHIDYIGLFRENSEHFSIHLISILCLHLIVQKKQVGCLKILQIIRGIRICNRIFSKSTFIETTADQSNSCHEISNHFFHSRIEECHLLVYRTFFLF